MKILIDPIIMTVSASELDSISDGVYPIAQLIFGVFTEVDHDLGEFEIFFLKDREVQCSFSPSEETQAAIPDDQTYANINEEIGKVVFSLCPDYERSSPEEILAGFLKAFAQPGAYEFEVVGGLSALEQLITGLSSNQ